MQRSPPLTVEEVAAGAAAPDERPGVLVLGNVPAAVLQQRQREVGHDGAAAPSAGWAVLPHHDFTLQGGNREDIEETYVRIPQTREES